jgi:hypothetical protein
MAAQGSAPAGIEGNGSEKGPAGEEMLSRSTSMEKHARPRGLGVLAFVLAVGPLGLAGYMVYEDYHSTAAWCAVMVGLAAAALISSVRR